MIKNLQSLIQFTDSASQNIILNLAKILWHKAMQNKTKQNILLLLFIQWSPNDAQYIYSDTHTLPASKTENVFSTDFLPCLSHYLINLHFISALSVKIIDNACRTTFYF